MNKEWVCECCKYTTNKKQTYERHLLSTKHLKQSSPVKTDNKRENPSEFNKKLLESIAIMEEKHKREIEKLTAKYEDQIQRQEEIIKSLKQ